MCGIAGILKFGNDYAYPERVRKMCDRIRHRGPERDGYFMEQKSGIFIGLGHRRLSIIDLSSGDQPIFNEDMSLVVVFNGEIYNYRELRQDLIKKHHHFRTESDTEVLVHLYEEMGDDFVNPLRGMFAIALWDLNRRSLILVRDRLGKKPIFYYHQNGFTAFASELQALTILPEISRQPNYEGIFQYLNLGYIAAPQTGFTTIYKIKPAEMIKIDIQGISRHTYWHINFKNKRTISKIAAMEELKSILTESVKLRMIADVPLGAFLSGGVDSSLIALLMAHQSSVPIKTFSIGFPHKDYNELSYARQVANYIHSDHHEFMVHPDAMHILPELVRHYGEPYSDSSAIPTYYVSKMTRQSVTVALNGDGGDESFIGYDRYRALYYSETYNFLPAWSVKTLSRFLPDSADFKNPVRRFRRFLSVLSMPTAQRYQRWISLADPSVVDAILGREFISKQAGSDYFSPYFSGHYADHPVEKAQYCDMMMYLPYDLLVKVDIASMIHSLESRSPLLDHTLVEFAASLPMDIKFAGSRQKYMLKKLLLELMPDYDIKRRKYGFGIPLAFWLRHDLKDLLRQTLLSETFSQRNLFRQDQIERLVNEHLDNKADHGYLLYALLMLELWFEEFL